MLAGKRMSYLAASRRHLLCLGVFCAVSGAAGISNPLALPAWIANQWSPDLFVATAVVAVALDLWRASDHQARFSDWAIFGFVLSIAALPGAATGWLALVMCGVLAVRQGDPAERGAGLVLVALGLLALKERVWGGLIRGTILEAEAWLVGVGLNWAAIPVEVTGNVLAFVDGRELVVLRGCSVFTLIVPALIGTLAVSRIVRPDQNLTAARLWLVASLVLAVNLVRLLGMALSPESYEWLHEGMGKTVLQVLVTLVVFGVGAWRRDVRP